MSRFAPPFSSHLLKACCAAVVILSASSKITILCLFSGSVTLFCAKLLILFLTTSMPLESEAFSSRTPTFVLDPRRARARAFTEVVLPVPGGPETIRLGRLPSSAMAWRREVVSSFPTTVAEGGRGGERRGEDGSEAKRRR